MSKLQILINHYNEPPELIGRLLKSIAEQTYTDYSVLICHDGEGGGISEQNYPFEYAYFSKPHRGVCQTRNSLLEASTAEYVMFCDADDMFSSPTGLQALLSHDADVIASPYNAERYDGTTHLYERDMIRVHGKVFRRSYLQEQRIDFPDVESNGDMYFLWLAFHLTENVVWIPENVYTWKCNPFSVTRRIPHYNTQRYDRALKCYGALARNLMQRGRDDLAREVIAANIEGAYNRSHADRWRMIPREYTSRAEAAIAAFLTEFADSYTANSPEIAEWIRQKVGDESGKRIHNP